MPHTILGKFETEGNLTFVKARAEAVGTTWRGGETAPESCTKTRLNLEN